MDFKNVVQIEIEITQGNIYIIFLVIQYKWENALKICITKVGPAFRPDNKREFFVREPFDHTAENSSSSAYFNCV